MGRPSRLSLAGTFFLLLTVSITLRSQVLHPDEEHGFPLLPLSEAEAMMLRALPELQMPPGYASRDLPALVDNSIYPWMRPVYNQDGLSCGQASGIGYNFTYEIDRARNLEANVIQNQYPTHFTWNFMNGGNGWYGVSYLHSFQILKECGNMNVADYGGAMGYGGHSRWISGYTAYYNGMHNRINRVYQIYVGDPEGLLTLKHWLHTHLDGSPTGGVASFYAQYMSATQTLPPGTPEAGKYVLTYFGGSANHAMTIVGYNDSIRWDYNSDGQYTNHIDINSDGEVNMKDWEIGGFKMVQSYGGVPNWGDQGYAYMMYKTVADDLGAGGIWNHCVHVLDVKPECDPKLTARIILKHDSRDKLKVMAGLSNNPAATQPDFTIGFPIYDYQAGALYMQGGTTEADKTIEFGLDLSPLLSDVNLGSPVRLFLQVDENDPAMLGTGQVVHFSIYDHTAGETEITSSQVNVPLVENDTTTLWVNHTFSFERVSITDEALPPAPQGEFFSHQMSASGGTEPYTWDFDKRYEESSSSAQFPMINQVQLSFSNTSSGFAMRDLEFGFPFYDSIFTRVAVHVDGYLMFDDQLFPYPYFMDDKNLFSITRNISPFMNHRLLINTSNGEGVWYEGDTSSAIFRWKVSIENYPNYQMNFALKIYPDGKIEYYYGNMAGCDHSQWIAGISDGDSDTHQKTAISNKPVVQADTRTTLERYGIPGELNITEEGLVTGTPAGSYAGLEIGFKVTDNNFISDFKTLLLTSTGIIVQDSIMAGGNQVIGFNETALMSIEVTNVEQDTIFDAAMTIHIDDPFITVLDSTEVIGNLASGQTVMFEDAFSFAVAPDVPDNHDFTIFTILENPERSWESELYHTAFAPVVYIHTTAVQDENGKLDPGDTCAVIVTYINSGGVDVLSLNTLLSSPGPDVDILQNYGNIALLSPGQQQGVTYTVAVSPGVLNGQVIPFHVTLSGDGDYHTSDDFDLTVGLFAEDFESATFNAMPWGFGGSKDWMIDPAHPYEGNFSAKSGRIRHDQESTLKIDVMVQAEGQVSFFKKVSCEDDPSPDNDFDFLVFSIDGEEAGRWDGESEWSYHTFPVSGGLHRFEWKYRKDGTTNGGYDAAWIDLVTFPAPLMASPWMTFSNDTITVIMRPDETFTDTLSILNNGPGNLSYAIAVAGVDPGANEEPGVRSMEGSWLTGSEDPFHPGEVYTLELFTYNSSLDNEWTEHIYLDFPEGMEVTSATGFIGASAGELPFTDGLGNGATVHWFGEDANGWGIIHPGEAASATVTVYVHDDFGDDGFLSYEIHGDIYGELPHIVTGTVLLQNHGPLTPWLTADPIGGFLPGNGSGTAEISIDPTGMADGTYASFLVVNDDFQHETVIPVMLTIDQFLGWEDGHDDLAAFNLVIRPNPFRDKIFIGIGLECPEEVTVIVSNPEGRLVTVFTDRHKVSAGRRWVEWDGRGREGNRLAPGVYHILVTGKDFRQAGKAVLTR